MSMVDDIKKGGISTVALGMSVLALVPAVVPVMVQGVRPLLRGAIKGSLVCLEKGQEAVAEIRQVLADVAAEARQEEWMEAGVKTGMPEVAAGEAEPFPPAGGEPDPEVMG